MLTFFRCPQGQQCTVKPLTRRPCSGVEGIQHWKTVMEQDRGKAAEYWQQVKLREARKDWNDNGRARWQLSTCHSE